MRKSSPLQQYQSQKQFIRKKDNQQKKFKNNLEQAKESVYDPSQIHNVPKNGEQKLERIRALIQIVQHTIIIFKDLLQNYGETQLQQQQVLLKLVSPKQKKHLIQFMDQFLKLRISKGKKQEIYQILYCKKINTQTNDTQIQVKRILRLIIYQIYYQKKFYDQIWNQYVKNKIIRNNPQNIMRLKKYISSQITDFRDQNIQKQKQMMDKQRTKINEKQQQKSYKNPNCQSQLTVQQFIDKLKNYKEDSDNEYQMNQEEKISQEAENQRQYVAERMQEQKSQNQSSLQRYFHQDAFIEKKNKQ